MEEPSERNDAPPPRVPAPPRAVMPLEYAHGRAPMSDKSIRRLIGALRQVALALGLGMAGSGVGESLLRNRDGPVLLAFGAALVGLALPLRRGDRI